MSIIHAMNKQWQATIIDTETTINRQSDYTTLSGTPFEGAEEVKEVKESNPLHEQYKEKFGKEVPVNKKNDEEWIIAKLND